MQQTSDHTNLVPVDFDTDNFNTEDDDSQSSTFSSDESIYDHPHAIDIERNNDWCVADIDPDYTWDAHAVESLPEVGDDYHFGLENAVPVSSKTQPELFLKIVFYPSSPSSQATTLDKKLQCWSTFVPLRRRDMTLADVRREVRISTQWRFWPLLAINREEYVYATSLMPEIMVVPNCNAAQLMQEFQSKCLVGVEAPCEYYTSSSDSETEPATPSGPSPMLSMDNNGSHHDQGRL